MTSHRMCGDNVGVLFLIWDSMIQLENSYHTLLSPNATKLKSSSAFVTHQGQQEKGKGT